MPFSVVEEVVKGLSLRKTSLPPNHILTKILAELLDLIELKDENGNNRIIIENIASDQPAILFGQSLDSCVRGITQALYHNEQPWGAYVVVKNINSTVQIFIHEMTHASCCLKYQSDRVNFQPKQERQVPSAPFPRKETIIGAPNYVHLMGQKHFHTPLVTLQWYDKDDEAFLFAHLSCLEQWADVTDFSIDIRRYQFVKGRITDAKYDSKGRIHCNSEYDSIINEMLFLMYHWKWFDPWNSDHVNPNISWKMLGEWIRDRKVPTWYFCSLVAQLASEAYDRREQAGLAYQQEMMTNKAKNTLDRAHHMKAAQEYRTTAKIKNPKRKIIPSPFIFINSPEPPATRQRKYSSTV